jgi:hypothetical protein
MDVVDTLYGWWLEQFRKTETQVLSVGVRSALGYEGTNLVPKQLSKAEFRDRLKRKWRELPVKQDWIDRFVVNREQELRQLPVDVQAFLLDCSVSLPLSLEGTGDDGDNQQSSLKSPHFTPDVLPHDA